MIALGCDHGGFELKQEIKKHLDQQNIEYIDYGCDSQEAVDYPAVSYTHLKPFLGEYKYGTIVVGNDEGKKGLMNLQQEVLIDYQYEILDNSGDSNCLTVREDGSWKIIGINNRVIVENMYVIEEMKDISFSNVRGGYISTLPEDVYKRQE